MRVLINIGHPAHVHFFKNMIWNLKASGYEVKIVATKKEIALDLLRVYDFDYEKLSDEYKTIPEKAYGILRKDHVLYKIAKNFKPDILLGVLDMYGVHIGKLIGKSSIIFTDTEHSKLANWLTFPFATTICTPSCFTEDLGLKQVRYNGYHELAYLHPNQFNPNPTVLEELDITKDDRFIILRFVSWGASHDIGQKGIDITAKRNYIKKLEDYGQIFITSEIKLTNDLEKYRIRLSPEKIHDLLYYATLYIGEGATMATEAAILGTPSIYISSLAGTMGNFDELQNKYGLVYSFTDPNQALEEVIELLEDKNLKSEWQKKREKLLKEKIDVTAWMTEFIENYPESFHKYSENKI